MEKKLKLVWDFYGPDAEKFAEHHAIHLNEYLAKSDLQLNITGAEKVEENHFMAFIVVLESEMLQVRDTLKPHRGFWYEG